LDENSDFFLFHRKAGGDSKSFWQEKEEAGINSTHVPAAGHERHNFNENSPNQLA
jgi:hypothetical protein